MRGDLIYIEERNKLIPQAERIANQKCGNDYGYSTRRKNYRSRDEWLRDWNTTFSETMNELARKAGL